MNIISDLNEVVIEDVVCEKPLSDKEISKLVDEELVKNTCAPYESKCITKENVIDMMRTYNPKSTLCAREKIMGKVYGDLCALFSRDYDSNIPYKALLHLLRGYIDVLRLLPELAILIKCKFEHIIVKEKMYDMISLYNKFFNDGLYDKIESNGQPLNTELTNELDSSEQQPNKLDSSEHQTNELTNESMLGQSEQPTESPYIDEQRINDLIADYNASVTERIRLQRSKRPPLKFDEGEVVGVKDKEGNWWMGRILKTFSHLRHNMYYVEFLGWGEEFNEFITDTKFKLERFNPRKHLYYRPAWKKKELEKEIVDDTVIENTDGVESKYPVIENENSVEK